MAKKTGTLVAGQEIHQRGIRRHLTWDKISMFIVFLVIPLLFYMLFVIWPFIQAIAYSFTDWNGLSPNLKFIGLQNYERLFADETTMIALRNNIVLLIFLPLVVVVLALALATMITIAGRSVGEVKGLRGAGFYRVVSFFPYTIPAVVVGVMWSQILNPSSGLVNGILAKLHLPQPIWLGDKLTAMPASIFIMIWGLVGFYMLLFIAAIKSVPAEVYEAARLDGASRLTIALRLTLPLIRENVQTGYIYLGIFAIDAYVYMSVLNATGGPENSTWVLAQELYQQAFGGTNQFGLACAIGVLMAISMGIFAALIFLVNRLTGGKDTVTLA